MGIKPHFRQRQHINIRVYDQIMALSGCLVSGFPIVLCGDRHQIAEIDAGLATGRSTVVTSSNPDRNIRPVFFTES